MEVQFKQLSAKKEMSCIVIHFKMLQNKYLFFEFNKFISLLRFIVENETMFGSHVAHLMFSAAANCSLA